MYRPHPLCWGFILLYPFLKREFQMLCMAVLLRFFVCGQLVKGTFYIVSPPRKMCPPAPPPDQRPWIQEIKRNIATHLL